MEGGHEYLVHFHPILRSAHCGYRIPSSHGVFAQGRSIVFLGGASCVSVAILAVALEMDAVYPLSDTVVERCVVVAAGNSRCCYCWSRVGNRLWQKQKNKNASMGG